MPDAEELVAKYWPVLEVRVEPLFVPLFYSFPLEFGDNLQNTGDGGLCGRSETTRHVLLGRVMF